MQGNLLALGGAVLGGALGVGIYYWCCNHGFVPIAVPGALAGIAAGLAKNTARWVPVACGLVALAAGTVADAVTFPFDADHSFGFYLAHIAEIHSIGMLTIAIGGLIGFWIPFANLKRQSDRGAN